MTTKGVLHVYTVNSQKEGMKLYVHLDGEELLGEEDLEEGESMETSEVEIDLDWDNNAPLVWGILRAIAVGSPEGADPDYEVQGLFLHFYTAGMRGDTMEGVYNVREPRLQGILDALIQNCKNVWDNIFIQVWSAGTQHGG